MAVSIVCAATGCAVDRTQPETGATAGTTDTTTMTTTGTTAGASTSVVPTGTTGAPGTTTTTASPTTFPAGTGTDSSTGIPTDQDEWCDVFDQACADGFKCTVYGEGEQYWTHWKCLPAPGSGQAGDPCEIDEGAGIFSGLDNCAVGHFCINFDLETGKDGTCIEICEEDLTCPNTNGGASLCMYSQGSGGPALCLATCDPLVQDCPDMQGCYGDPSLADFICYEFDPGQNTGQDGTLCEFTNACLPGLSCQPSDLVDGCDPGWAGCCTPFCSVSGGDGACGPAEDCVQFYPDPPVGLADVGVCRIPA